jgi:hypothetical protein
LLKRTHRARPTPWWPPRPTKAAHSKIPSSRLRLARGHTPPSGMLRPVQGCMLTSSGLRLARGYTPSSNGLRLARERSARVHACSRTRVRAFNALTTAGRRHHAPGTHAPVLLHQLPRGNPSPPLWGTVRHGRCQPRDAAPPTPVRLTCRALEGGPSTPSKCFPVTLQGQVVTLGRRGAIPATVNCRCLPPHVQPHAGHCGNSSGSVRHARTGRHHACHCIPYGSSSATPRTRLRTSRPTTALLPSKPPLFGYKIRHDGQIAARTVRAAAYSTAWRTILPHVAE